MVLSQDQLRVLRCIGAFQITGSETIRADMRCAFVELEALKLIEPVRNYQLTDLGRRALAEVFLISDAQKGNDDG